MHRIVVIVVSLAVVCGLVWQFPLFHVVKLSDQQSSSSPTKFDAASLVQKSWDQKLPAQLEKAADAGAVLTALQNDLAQTRQKYGRTLGMGRAFCLLLRGSGKIVGVEKNTVRVVLDSADGPSEIVLPTGPLFGNAVRNATGMFDANDFTNSQQFNDISTELNKIVETKIISSFKQQAEVGKHIQFVGCAEILDAPDQRHPLAIVPVEVKFD